MVCKLWAWIIHSLGTTLYVFNVIKLYIIISVLSILLNFLGPGCERCRISNYLVEVYSENEYNYNSEFKLR